MLQAPEKNKQESKTQSRIEFSASFAPDLLLCWVEEAHFCYLQWITIIIIIKRQIKYYDLKFSPWKAFEMLLRITVGVYILLLPNYPNNTN